MAEKGVSGNVRPSPGGNGTAESLALGLFVCTGLALPFYAFPVLRVAGRSVDLATLFAALFVAASLVALGLRLRIPVSSVLFVLAAALPLLVLIEPRPPRFEPSRFAPSFGHWLLVVSVFFAASFLRADGSWRRLVVTANCLMGGAIAAFGLYQATGHPAGWPGTGSLLLNSQREPLRLLPIGESGYLRPTSVFLEPAWLGGYLAFSLAALLGALSAGTLKRRVSRTIVVAALVTVLLCALATVSWGAYADLAAVLAAGLWAMRERFRASPKTAALAGGILVLVLVAGMLSPPGRAVVNAASERWRMLLGTPVGEDVPAQDVSDSSWMRFQNLRHTEELIGEHPWRGVGLGQFGRYAQTSASSFIAAASTRDPWCGWLAIAAETGLLGPFVLAGFLLAVVWRGSAGRRLRGNASDEAFRRVTVPALVLLALVQQAHTGSYIDLWWWYPLSVATLLAAPSIGSPPAILESGP